jgi:type II secretory pathway component PulF
MLSSIKDYFDPDKRPPKVNLHDLCIFIRQLATMLEAGIALHQALNYLGKSANKDLRRVLDAVSRKVESGSTLSWALRQYPKIFSEVICALVETGELTGMLTPVLQRVADLQEKTLNMHKKLIATVTYPLVLVTVSGMSLLFFVFFVLPSTVPLFASLNIALPWPTKLLLATRYIIPAVFGIVAVLFILYKVFNPVVEKFLDQNPKLKEIVQSLPLRIPVFGGLYTKMLVARMLFALASMIENGVNLLPAVKRSAATSSNQWVIERMRLAETQLRDGDLLSVCLNNTQIFPRTAIYLIAVGEETSQLSEMLQHAANIFEEEVDLELVKFSALIEPLIMMVMGIVVGFIVISSLLPMLKLIQNL